ncbi:hypothetical protein NGUA41_01936 [Salmonella enterica]|nr:hypothetical protein NGUA40_04810 [Salmonella enterica]GAS77081.1 hypothetical protein NGUA41_01936 [Salmonella enterica]
MDYGIMIVNDAGNPFITPQSVPISLHSKGSANSVKLSATNSTATVTLARPNSWGAVIPFAYTTQPCALKASVDANNNLVVTANSVLAASFTLSVFLFTEFTPTLPDYGFASWNAAGDLVFTNEMKVLTDVQTLGNPASDTDSGIMLDKTLNGRFAVIPQMTGVIHWRNTVGGNIVQIPNGFSAYFNGSTTRVNSQAYIFTGGSGWIQAGYSNNARAAIVLDVSKYL